MDRLLNIKKSYRCGTLKNVRIFFPIPDVHNRLFYDRVHIQTSALPGASMAG